MADDGMPRLWWAVGAVAILGLVMLNLTAPEQVLGIPAGQFQMLYMATFVLLLTFIMFSENELVRALGLSIVAVGFLSRVAQPAIGERISLIIGLACIAVGFAINIFGGALADSRATSGA